MPKKKVSQAEQLRRKRQSESSKGVIYVSDGAGGLAKMMPLQRVKHRVKALN